MGFILSVIVAFVLGNTAYILLHPRDEWLCLTMFLLLMYGVPAFILLLGFVAITFPRQTILAIILTSGILLIFRVFTFFQKDKIKFL